MLGSGPSSRCVVWPACLKLYNKAHSAKCLPQGPIDLEDDVTAGFDLISTWDLDERGVDWIADKIKSRVGSGPVVISLDVDVLDPSYVPASESCDSCDLRLLAQSTQSSEAR